MHPCTVLTNKLTYFASTRVEYLPHYPKVDGLISAPTVDAEKVNNEGMVSFLDFAIAK
jgi:hypothetical protein